MAWIGVFLELFLFALQRVWGIRKVFGLIFLKNYIERRVKYQGIKNEVEVYRATILPYISIRTEWDNGAPVKLSINGVNIRVSINYMPLKSIHFDLKEREDYFKLPYPKREVNVHPSYSAIPEGQFFIDFFIFIPPYFSQRDIYIDIDGSLDFRCPFGNFRKWISGTKVVKREKIYPP